MKQKYTVVIADDHEIFRKGILLILNASQLFQIVSEARNGNEAIEKIRSLKPDLCLLDIFMPERTGIEVVQELSSELQGSKVVMLTSLEDEMNIQKAIMAGVDGYLSKEISPENLIESLQKVMEGERIFSKTVLALLNNRKSHTLEEINSLPVTLTKREQEILELVALEYTTKEIADKLFLSPRTIETHRANIMRKLDVKNAAGLVRFSLTQKFDV
ncbi:MAG: response regulator transcription factor [Candidatus Kapabacteria bacterium]|nr:response regulator transcription factor [Candidatus Kapabacteria bacterium]